MRPVRAVEADVVEVAALEQRLFGVEAWSAEAVREELTGPRRVAVVGREATVLVGYAVTVAVGEDVDLQRIGVHPDHRRRGVARALLAAVAPPGRLLLEVSVTNAAARAFYAAEGFAEAGRRRGYYGDGSDAVVLARPAGGPGRETQWSP